MRSIRPLLALPLLLGTLASPAAGQTTWPPTWIPRDLASTGSVPSAASPERRERLRDLGVVIGHYPPGRWNAITDVGGVRVGQVTHVQGEGRLVPGVGPVRTGITAVVPRDDVWRHKVFAGGFVLNGNGEVTGWNWIQEAGWLEVPILLTGTLNVPRVADGVISWMEAHYPDMGRRDDVVLPVVAECDDMFLNDERGRHVDDADVAAALDGARSGPVAEGCVGAGTGMVAYRFKAGIGTSSRVLPKEDGGYTVGVLVNANMGSRRDLTIAGVPVGDEVKGAMPVWRGSDAARVASRNTPFPEGSIIIVVATDAPLLPHQLTRLAKRAALGLARTGSDAHHSSGDFVLAFSTAADVPHEPTSLTMPVKDVVNQRLDPLFEGTAEATEEAIDDALCMATTTVGRDGNTAYALPLDQLRAILARYGRPGRPGPAR